MFRGCWVSCSSSPAAAIWPGSFSALLMPGHSVNVAALTFIGEALFTLWLLAKGRNVTLMA